MYHHQQANPRPPGSICLTFAREAVSGEMCGQISGPWQLRLIQQLYDRVGLSHQSARVCSRPLCLGKHVTHQRPRLICTHNQAHHCGNVKQ